MIRRIRALTTDVSVEIDDDLPLAEVARALIAPYPDAIGAPTLRYHLRGGPAPALIRDDAAPEVADHPGDVVPRFELDLYRRVSADAQPGWVLHAAALRGAHGVVVLAGPSGAGKTTLTLGLQARGIPYLTEEIVLIDRDGVVHGLARPVQLPRAAAGPAGWEAVPYPIRRRDDVVVAHSVLVPPRAAVHAAPAPLHALVHIGHEPGALTSLSPTGAAAALFDLWPCTLRQDRAGLDAATDLLARYAAYRLRSGDVAGALAEVAPLLTP